MRDWNAQRGFRGTLWTLIWCLKNWLSRWRKYLGCYFYIGSDFRSLCRITSLLNRITNWYRLGLCSNACLLLIVTSNLLLSSLTHLLYRLVRHFFGWLCKVLCVLAERQCLCLRCLLSIAWNYDIKKTYACVWSLPAQRGNHSPQSTESNP
jgi:hypothetical protein